MFIFPAGIAAAHAYGPNAENVGGERAGLTPLFPLYKKPQCASSNDITAIVPDPPGFETLKRNDNQPSLHPARRRAATGRGGCSCLCLRHSSTPSSTAGTSRPACVLL